MHDMCIRETEDSMMRCSSFEDPFFNPCHDASFFRWWLTLLRLPTCRRARYPGHRSAIGHWPSSSHCIGLCTPPDYRP
jgi:hypothetical protein